VKRGKKLVFARYSELTFRRCAQSSSQCLVFPNGQQIAVTPEIERSAIGNLMHLGQQYAHPASPYSPP
jgi:hypothetical protein